MYNTTVFKQTKINYVKKYKIYFLENLRTHIRFVLLLAKLKVPYYGNTKNISYDHSVNIGTLPRSIPGGKTGYSG